MKRHYILILILSLVSLCVSANSEMTDSIGVKTVKKKPSLFKRVADGVVGFVEEMNRVDTTYIEPERFKFTVMGQANGAFEIYRVATNDSRSLTFSPDFRTTVGPYFGYSVLGYGLDLQIGKLSGKGEEIEMSLFSSMLGVDLFYRNNGNDFNISRAVFGQDVYGSKDFRGDFDGFRAKSMGVNVYYIFNHHNYSHPAMFGQSTIQRRSAGSPLVALGWSKHQVGIDWEKVDEALNEALPGLDSQYATSSLFDQIKYVCYSAYGGYAYNWVLARNLAAGMSIALGLAYNHSESRDGTNSFKSFSMGNMSIDGVGRVGLVWNNGRWFVGGSAVAHSYRYRKSQFSTNNTFGDVNCYFGVYLGKYKQYRKPGNFFEL